MGKNNRNTGALLLLILGSALPAVVSAGAPDQLEDSAVTVSYGDLDIQSEAGAKVLYSRLKRASEKACNVESFTEHGSVDSARDARLCYRAKIARAVDNIDSEPLKRMHAG